MLDPSVADLLRSRPRQKAVMTQRWANLSFLHFAMDPAEVQKSLPEGLTVDTFPDEHGNEKAWIGLIPFQIQDLALGPRLKIPSASTFLETNVRTYVHRDGKDPGVWFYSLDAASNIACRAARILYGLPYWHARMSLSIHDQVFRYEGRRFANPLPHYKVQTSLGEPISPPQPGSLEFFLVERYLLYSQFRGKLRTGRVYHPPYPLHSLQLDDIQEELVAAAGFSSKPIISALFSRGVEVEIFPLV